MPSTINGCGTWYYGKKSRQVHQGVCAHCHCQAQLASYDTRLWVVALYMPIFPLGKKRIIEECPNCRRHGVMPLQDWHRVQRRGQEAVTAYNQSPSNPELAKEAMVATVGFRDVNGFAALAGQIEQHLTAHASTMAMVGGAYMLFHRHEDAERVLRAALAHHEQDEELREGLAACLMRQGEPEEAEPLLQHIVDKGIPDRVDALYELAQAYQIKGQHPHAVAIFDQCELVNPHMAQDPTFQRLREASRKRIGGGAKVNPMAVVAEANREASMRKFRRWAPVAAVLAVVAYVMVAWIQGMSREVFVVNGLSKPYTVALNGTSYELAPQTAMRIRLGEGDVHVAIANAPPGIEPETVQIATSLLTRPFSSATFVINPDRAAVLEQVRLYYGDKDNAYTREPRVTIAGGQMLHRFDGLDYPFEPFPDSISADRGAHNVGRDGLGIFGQDLSLSPAVALMNAMDELGPEATTKIAQRHLMLEPSESEDEYLAVLGRTMKPEESAEFLRPRLDARPVVMRWHRAYQEAMKAAGQEREAEREYTALLAKDPGNGDMMYLLARVTQEPAKGAALCRQAASLSPPSAWAHFWLSGYHHGRGEFDVAADHGATAVSLAPESPEIHRYVWGILLAAERWEPLLAMLEAAEEGPISTYLPALMEQAYVRQQMNQPEAANAAVERLQAKLNAIDATFALHRSRLLRASLDYSGGDTSKFIDAAKEHGDETSAMAALLTLGDLPAAQQKLAAMNADPDSATIWNVLVYIVAMHRDESQMAKPHLQAAIESLAKRQEDEHRHYADLLASGSAEALDRVLDQHDQIERKAAILTAAGLAHPALREKAFTLAAKLNCDKRFPHLLLKEAMQPDQAR